MKKTLLASTALVGAALLAAPASAGTVGSKDGMDVSLSGVLWFSVSAFGEDVSAGRGRGYRFAANEAEIHVTAKNTADNGITYGFTVELNAGANDGTAADEAYAFISSDWGRLELGDNDDAADKLSVGSYSVNKGTGGPYGGLGTQGMFSGRVGEAMATNLQWTNAITHDATKATYVSPSFGGFQIGASLTPDSGQNSGNGGVDADNNLNNENVISYGAKYSGKFDEIGLTISFTGLTGGAESLGTLDVAEDPNIWALGGKVDFAGFSVAANYVDFDDTGILKALSRTGADAGSTWSVGLGYASGPWGVSAWYLDHEKNNSTLSGAGALESELTRIGFGVGYTVAPGWKLTGDVEIFSHDNISANGAGTTTDNDGRGFMLNNQFSF